MMQKGTGERFSYKKAVTYFYSKARSLKTKSGRFVIIDFSTNYYLTNHLGHKSAENAWTEAFEPLHAKYDLIKLFERLECSKEDFIISDVRATLKKVINIL